MKTIQILNINAALAKLFQIDEKTPLSLSGVDRMKLATLAIKVANVVNAYDKTRIGLARKAGLGPDNQVLPEKREEFFAELESVLDTENDLMISPMSAKAFADEKGISMALLAELIQLGIVAE